MLTITFADGTTIEALDDTTVYPSGSPSVRSRMEIHLAENEMDLEAFEALVSDEEKTQTITFVKTGQYTNVFTNFCILTKVGKELVSVVNNNTGEASEEMHLVARLEQLTYTEQLVKANADATDEIGAQALYTAMMTDTLLEEE